MVSLVMRDAAGPSEATRRRVAAAAAELGYRPDARARSLAGHSARLFGVVFGVVGTFHFDLLEGLYAAAEQNRYGLLLSALTPGRDEAKALESLQDFRSDALVMLGPPVAAPLVAGKIPVVVIGWSVNDPKVDVVRTSDVLGMAQALDHLVRLGHRQIAHLDGGPGLISQSRREAYEHEMAVRELGAYVRVLHSGGESQLEGQRAMRAALEDGDLPTAIIAYNDDAAVAAMAVLEREGVQVPNQVAIIGWDNSEVAGLARVDLTSVAQRPFEMARLAIERLVARCAGDAGLPREIILEPELLVRSSTAPPRPAGRRRRKA